jgi:hypothetical protein
MIDFISKGGNMYILLEQLNVKQENLDDIKAFIDALQEIAREKKYIKYTDIYTQQ